MNRTVALPDKWYYHSGKKPRKRAGGFLKKSIGLPYSDKTAYTLSRKFICPKQINDTVTVFFECDDSIKVFASGKPLVPFKDEYDRTVYDVTPALKKGSTVISAVSDGGSIDAFYFRVQRKE